MKPQEALKTYHVGQRVQLHPATDRWMMGDKYGTVEKIGRYAVHVRLDRSGVLYHASPLTLTVID